MSDKEILLFTFLGVIAVLLFVLIFLVLKSKNSSSLGSSKLIQDQIFNLSKIFDAKLSESNKLMNNSLSKTFETSSNISQRSNKVIEDITKKLTNLEETNKQIKDI
jgi:hypothetical protein